MQAASRFAEVQQQLELASQQAGKEEVEVQKVTEQLEQITQLAVSRCLQLETMSEEHRY